MSIGTLIVAIFIATIFAAWPIVGRSTGMSGSWIAAIVMLGTAFSASLLTAKELFNTPFPAARPFIFLLVVSLINGLAVWLYAVKAADKNIPTISTFLVTVAILVMIIAPTLDWMLNGAVPTPKQFTGFVVAVGAVYLLA